jgi:hypothetical protein
LIACCKRKCGMSNRSDRVSLSSQFARSKHTVEALFRGERLTFKARAPLRCVPSSQNRASTPTRETRACWGPRLCWEQLRASLRRKEMFFSSMCWHDFAAFARCASRKAERSSRALTLDLAWTRCVAEWDVRAEDIFTHPFAKSAKGWGTRLYTIRAMWSSLN